MWGCRAVANDRAVDHCGVCCVGKPAGEDLPASYHRGHACRHRLFRAVRRSPRAVPAVLRQTKPVGAGEALHRTQHRAHPAGVQSRSDRSRSRSAAEQKLTFKTLDANKATIENIRLWDWQPLSDTYAQLQEIRTYDNLIILTLIAIGSMAPTKASVILGPNRGLVAAAECPDMGQPPRAVYSRHRRGDEPGHWQEQRGLPFFYLRDIPPLHGGPHSVTVHPPRRGARQLRHRQGEHT